ncbi:exocyst complex subunit Sec15-like-domain-containing protein [Catenaria anguillulae PL171]|uniref:Exocyst complex component SEC15 n=1 Tax=Catenaria anguillulae PL171 TaxID=765915 RepID=A0A1Y2HUE3_9FUNG|nr:exocyst complex subunit Sec15-like-domain-containing protein [Catenaria anguillulae PL171]
MAIDDLDQLGPLLKSLIKAGRQEKYLDQLAAYIAKQDAEIERLCNFHYQEFIQSVDQLLKVRTETLDLKATLTQLSAEFNTQVKSSVDKKRDLIHRRQMLVHLENTIEAISQCQSVLDLALRAKSLYETRKYYSALRCIDTIRAQLLPLMSFEFAKYMSDGLPKLQLAIRTAVHADLRDWFVAVREQQRKVGQVALDKAKQRIEQRRQRQHQRSASGVTTSMAAALNHLEGLEGFGQHDDQQQQQQQERFLLQDNDQVHVDFRPLYQAIHIDTVLGTLPELVADFEEQRRLQANLFLSLSSSSRLATNGLASADDLPQLTNLLNDVAGFFLIESTIASTTVQFRSRAAVDTLWDQTLAMLYNLVHASLLTLTDPPTYLAIQHLLVPFLETLHPCGYSTTRVAELLTSLFERYCDLLKQACSETCHELVDEDSYAAMVAKDANEYDRIRRTLRIAAIDGPASQAKGGWPRTLAFSAMVPGVCEQVEKYICEYYAFASGIAAHHAVGKADLDDVLRRAVDNLLVRYVHQPLRTLVEGQGTGAGAGAGGNLAQILQAYLNLDAFAMVSAEVERDLASKRRITLQATESFVTAKQSAEKRIYDMFNRKISEFIELAEYDFMPTGTGSSANKVPSPYLRDLVNFLTGVLYSTLDNLPNELKRFIYFEAFDHLANGMMDLILNPSVRRINMAFVDHFAGDVEFLERFVNGLGDANVQDTFVVLRQTINLLRAENPAEYLDATIAHRRYNRLKKANVVALMEKLNNAAGLFAHKTDKNRRKGYETVIAALKKELAERSGPPSPMRG